MTAATSQPFSPTELAWIRTQSAENPALNTVAFVCDGTLDPDHLKSRIEDRLLPVQRLRQRIGHTHLPLARPRWQGHDGFNLTDHLFVGERLAGEPFSALGDWLEHASSQPLDEDLPLWQAHLLELEDDTSVVVLRIHSAIADSRAAAALALRLTDDEGSHSGVGIGLEPFLSASLWRDLSGGAAEATRTLCRLITSRADHQSPFRRSPLGAKRLSWSDPEDLDRIRSRVVPAGFSVTEAALSAVAGGLRRSTQRQDVPAEDIDLRAVVALDLRRADDEPLGTRSALGLLRLPLDQATSEARYQAVRHELERLAQTPQDFVLLGCETGLNLTMSEIEEQSLRLLSQKATIALALLDGPADPQLLCDRPVTALLWWPALHGDLALGISLIAYAGTLRFAVSCDRALASDPATLAADMAAATEG